MKKVRLHYSNGSHRGPGKVVQNLSRGLQSLDLIEDASFGRDSFHGFLQLPGAAEVAGVLASGKASPDDCLFGPNLTVIPTEVPQNLLQQIRHMVVPSDWVRNLYRRFPEVDKITIDVWPVGIDTDRWQPSDRGIRSVGPITEPLRCLLYYKNRTPYDLKAVLKLLSDKGIEVKVLTYGEYSEAELESLCAWAHFGILLTNTESQGIAYMEMLSTDLPLFVFDYPEWDYDGAYTTVSATSIPYFDKRCGVSTVRFDKQVFEEFLHGVTTWKFYPRAYILENHTLKHAAQNYYNILVRNATP